MQHGHKHFVCGIYMLCSIVTNDCYVGDIGRETQKCDSPQVYDLYCFITSISEVIKICRNGLQKQCVE